MAKLHRKTHLVKKIKDELLNHQFVLIGQYTKINVRQFEFMRNKLRNHASALKIYKNNLLKLAFQNTSFSPLNDYLSGPNCVIKTEGEAFPLFALLHQFKKEFKTLEWRVGVWNGEILDQTKIRLLGQIPNRTVLLQRLLMTLQTPFYHLHATLRSLGAQWEQTKQHHNTEEKREAHQ